LNFSGFDEIPTKSKYEVHGRIPKLTLKAKYVVDGKVLILPIQGNGNSTLSLGEQIFYCTLLGNEWI
jgi:hypothetical protein